MKPEEKPTLAARLTAIALYPLLGRTKYQTYRNISTFGTVCQVIKLFLVLYMVPFNTLLWFIPVLLLLEVLGELGTYSAGECKHMEDSRNKKKPEVQHGQN